MTKKIAIAIGLLILGLTISVLVESQLRHLIQTLFRRLTDDAIHFYGKDFHFFASPYYYLGFGLSPLIIWFSWDNLTVRQRSVDGLLAVTVFFVSVIIIGWIICAVMLAECTACDDGTRGIHYSDINYDGITIASLFLSIAPGGLRQVVKRRKQPAHNNVYKKWPGSV